MVIKKIKKTKKKIIKHAHFVKLLLAVFHTHMLFVWFWSSFSFFAIIRLIISIQDGGLTTMDNRCCWWWRCMFRSSRKTYFFLWRPFCLCLFITIDFYVTNFMIFWTRCVFRRNEIFVTKKVIENTTTWSTSRKKNIQKTVWSQPINNQTKRWMTIFESSNPNRCSFPPVQVIIH